MYDRSMEIKAQAYRERQLEKANRSRLVKLAQGQEAKGRKTSKVGTRGSSSLRPFGRLVRAG